MTIAAPLQGLDVAPPAALPALLPLPSAATLIKKASGSGLVNISESSSSWEESSSQCSSEVPGQKAQPPLMLPSLDHPLGYEGLMDLDSLSFAMK